jgi:hypothetical protein
MSNKYNVKLYKNDKLEKEYKKINVLENKELYFFTDSIKNIIGDNYYIRENEEFKFYIDFIKKECNYLLKEKNMLFDIKVFKAEINKNNNDIDIIYHIETSEEELKISINKI